MPKIAALPLALALLLSAPAVLAQDAAAPASAGPGDMVERFARGRAVILAAAQAAGGVQALRGLKGLSYALEIDLRNDIQGYRAGNAGKGERDGAQRVSNRIDFAGTRFSQHITQDFTSGYNAGFGFVWEGGRTFNSRDVPRDYTLAANSPSPFAAGGAVMVSSRWLPPVILQRALANARSIAWLGEVSHLGNPADLVEISFDEAMRFRLTVTRAERRIAVVETIAPDPVSGDDTTVSLLEGEQRVGGLAFPLRIVSRRRGAVNQVVALTGLAVNPAFAAADFAPPAGYAEIALPGKVEARRVSGRVWEVAGLAGGTYQVPFVVMDDFVVAYEAPLGIPASRQVIAEIGRVAPGKPIRYVVVSHFHADHAGGIGAYAELGATVLSSAENQAILARYAANNRPLSQGQDGPRQDIAIRFEAVPASGLTLTDAKGGKLKVIDFPANSHAEHMLALYDAESGVFMGADHLITAVAWNPTFAATARWLRANPGARTVLGVHDLPQPREAVLARSLGGR